MVNELPGPGMQHAEQGQASAKVLRLGRDVLQGGGAFAEEHAIEQPLVLPEDRPQRFGHGEGDQEVRHTREELLLLALQPGLRLSVSALAASPVAAAVVGKAFCTTFTKRFPFAYSLGHAWRHAHPDQDVTAADLRPDGALYDAYPLFSEPPSGPRRDAVDHARIGHNHWALEQILSAIRASADSGTLQAHVAAVVAAYVPTTSRPFAEAVTHGLRFATDELGEA